MEQMEELNDTQSVQTDNKNTPQNISEEEFRDALNKIGV